MMNTIPAMNSNISPEVLAEIETRVDRVRVYLKQATSAWLLIAKEFAVAREALSQLAYERFVNDVGVTKSVADKLVCVGGAKPLYVEENQNLLATVEGWTVLYELSKLGQDKINSLLREVADDGAKLTREMIYNFANNKPLDSKRLIVASIEVDEDKLKSLSSEQYIGLKNQVDFLKAEISRLNAGFILKSRVKTLVKIEDCARANSAALIIQTAA